LKNPQVATPPLRTALLSCLVAMSF
jgi:hypothetical protein